MPVNVNVSCGQTTSGGPGRRARERHKQARRERRDDGYGEMSSFHRESLLVSGSRPIVRPPATGPLPTGYRPRAVLEFRVLGPLEVVGDDGPIRLGGPRQRATLAILLLNANRVVPVERLADDLYAGRPPVSAVTQVQRQVSELRRALGSADAIETRPPGYAAPRSATRTSTSRASSA